MIALDTSAIIAIVRDEQEAGIFAELIARGGAIVGTPTLLETHMVLSNKLHGGVEDFFARFIGNARVRSVAFSLNMFQLAQDAFDRYGKGRHPQAALNFGDCLTYAVAKYHDVPLLYKGEDFRHTDLRPALP
jgi:ribonuclease VapC